MSRRVALPPERVDSERGRLPRTHRPRGLGSRTVLGQAGPGQWALPSRWSPASAPASRRQRPQETRRAGHACAHVASCGPCLLVVSGTSSPAPLEHVLEGTVRLLRRFAGERSL